MFKKVFTSLNNFSVIRGFTVAISSVLYDAYEIKSASKQILTIYEINADNDQIIRHNDIIQKLMKLNDGKTDIPKIGYADNFKESGAYIRCLNTIMLPKRGPINDFVLAHEFAHWKLGHGEDMTTWSTRTISYGLLGMSPINALIPIFLAGTLILYPNYRKHGSFLARSDLDENAADQFALERGFAKEGYQYFENSSDNIYDTEHPLASHRAALCYMKWKLNEPK